MFAFNRMPPRWKIRREILRIAEQARCLIGEVYEPFLKFLYDRKRASIIEIFDGPVAFSHERVAVFLIYQPSGIPESVFSTCHYLVQSGYSPLIVCNSPLTSADRARLLETSWKCMFRPNYGYDFGGYRDAVWLLNKLNISPQFLLFLNDSIWFPIASNATVLEEMETSQAEYVGALENTIGKRKLHLGFYYPSYLFMIKGRVFRSKEFQEFWETYPVSSIKRKVILRGEIRLSKILITSRFLSASIFPGKLYSDTICQLDSKSLKDVLTCSVCTNEHMSNEKMRLIDSYKDSQYWSDECQEFLSINCNNFGAFPFLPVFSIEKLGVPFFKKLRIQRFVIGQRMILSAAHSGKFENAIFDHVLEEMESNVSSSNF